MRYPVDLQPDSGGYVVSFPDIPEALTQGDTREEALAMAQDALITAFDFYFEDNQPIPLPSEVTCDYVDVPLSVASKVLMLNALIESGLTRVELADRIGIKKQEVNRLIDLNHSTKIDAIQRAMKALGKRLDITAL